jgi:L-2-hydroxyglutarate oxidase LhgO
MDIIEYDYVIVGAGIVGLTIARHLLQQKSSAKIVIIEKEPSIGCHASGRNSGVLHSGIYYSKNTLKSKVCSSGSRMMTEYCVKNKIPIKKVGKVIVQTNKTDVKAFEQLIKNANDSNLQYELIDRRKLQKIEPYAVSATNSAIHLPEVSIVNPKIVLRKILDDLISLGATINFNEKLVGADVENSIAITNIKSIKYGYLINAAGQYADKIAQFFNVGKQYTILPFKGSYFSLRKGVKSFSNGLIYPVPDLNRPFLGVHTVKDMKGNTYFGPTAVPVFGRENYHGMSGMKFTDATRIIYFLSKMYYHNKQGFRYYAHHEALNNIKSNFTKSAQKLVSGINKNDLLASNKSGIRPQLFDKDKNELVMDLKIEETKNTLHILNAISPAFTASFSFSELIVSKILGYTNIKLEEGVKS